MSCSKPQFPQLIINKSATKRTLMNIRCDSLRLAWANNFGCEEASLTISVVYNFDTQVLI